MHGFPLAERFWAKVDKTGGPLLSPHVDTPCWLWVGSIRPDGYGQFAVRTSTPIPAHQQAWALAHGRPPRGLWVLHRCDVRHCVRPTHLFLGTPKDNAQDMARKGRWGNQFEKGSMVVSPPGHVKESGDSFARQPDM